MYTFKKLISTSSIIALKKNNIRHMMLDDLDDQ